ncbi:trans-aconitate 2-methyltransferase-like [Glandiceps talaboti]
MNFSNQSGLSYVQLRSTQLDKFWKFLAERIDWKEDDVVLDIGCGTGSFTKLIADRGNIKSITGYDISPAFIAVAKKEENNTEGKTIYEVGDARDAKTLKSEWKNAFSKAICIATFQFIDEKEAFLRNVCDCLKPGGVFFMRFHHGNVLGTLETLCKEMSANPKWKALSQGFNYDKIEAMLFRGTIKEFTDMVLACGFSEAKVEETFFYNYAVLSEEGHKEYISVQFGQLKYIPEDKKKKYIDETYNRFQEIAPKTDDGKLAWRGPTWTLTAKK